jgi:phage-related protein
MSGRWKIAYYETASGKWPVKEVIDGIEERLQAKVYNTFELLVEFGTKLGMPHVKKVSSTQLWELRVLGGRSLRFFYVVRMGRKFLILHGFVKKNTKTPRREIKVALARLRDHEERFSS